MNLERLQQLLRTYFIPAIFIVAVVVVGSWFLVFRDKPAEEKFGKLPSVEIKSVVWDLIKIKTNTKLLKLDKAPKTLPVYLKGEPIGINEVAKKLGFKKTAKKTGKNLDWEDGQKTLTFSTSTLHLSYYRGGDISGGSLTEPKALAKAREILSGLSLVDQTTALKSTKVDRLLVANRTHPEPVGEGENFEVYAITFQINLNGFSLLNETGTDHVISVWVDKRGELRNLSASTQSYRTSDKSTYNIKDLGQVKEDLEKGRGKIVNIESGFPTKVASVDVNYTSAQIGYLMSSKDKYIRPFYFVEGFVRVNKFTQSKVGTFLSAIESID